MAIIKMSVKASSNKGLCLLALLASQSLTSCLATGNKINQRNSQEKAQQESMAMVADASRFLDILQERERERERGLLQEDTYECNTVIASFPQSTMAEMFASLLNQLLPQQSSLYGSLFNDKTNFGVRLVKVCASCQDVRPMFMSGAPTNSAKEAFEKYCGIDVYANDVAHSGLVLFPLEDADADADADATSPSVIKSGTSPGFVYTRPTRVATYNVPSMETTSGMDFLFGFLATMANGFVSILPDYMGYGSSPAAVRNYIVRDAYVTATLPLWIKTAETMDEETGSAAALADAAYYAGYSEGGYASMAIADGLSSLDVKPLTVMAGGGPYRHNGLFLLRSAVAAYDNGTPPGESYSYILALIGSTYSSANPNLRSMLDGQNVLAGNLMDSSRPETNVLAWLNEPTIDRDELVVRMKANNLTTPDALWDATLLSIIREANANNVTNICDEGNARIDLIDNLCTVFDRNDLIETMENADYPINIFHSPIDEVVPFEMIPDEEANMFLAFKTSPSLDHTFFGAYFIGQEVPMFIADKHVDVDITLRDGPEAESDTSAASALSMTMFIPVLPNILLALFGVCSAVSFLV